MKPILKVYGLPHTGTNVLYWLLVLNFKTYTCSKNNFGVDYLGWKHGVPLSKEAIKCIKYTTNEEPLFIITNRSYDSWSEAILNRHHNTWEFPEKFQKKPYFVFNTPMGIETYKSLQDFYEKRTEQYITFYSKNEKKCIFVNFQDLQTRQEDIVKSIEQKFLLEKQYDKVITIHKKINSDGIWFDTSPLSC